MKKGISVIICCYNSAARLQRTLQHLALQETGKLNWEIILVDNASTDNTTSIAMQTWDALQRQGVELKAVYEKKPGLSFARQTGVDAANFECIIFCDDDNWLHSDYLQKAFDILEADKSIGALGGVSVAAGEIELPVWFKSVENAYAVGTQATRTGIINERGYISGAGMATRKQLFQQTINEQLPGILNDRQGKNLSTGGDVEYCLRLILQGFNIYYCEALQFKHFIPAYRLTKEYCDEIFKGVESARSMLNIYFEAVKIKNANKAARMRLWAKASKDILKSFLRKRELQLSTSALLFFVFNIGYKNRPELKIIKHFYDA
jgi:glycosyltransferase involved in cell wall biosynthesis